MYRSKSGEVGTREYWEKWMLDSYQYSLSARTTLQVRDKNFQMPSNWWDRMSKILGLEKIS